jgi:hypothetical protein
MADWCFRSVEWLTCCFYSGLHVQSSLKRSAYGSRAEIRRRLCVYEVYKVFEERLIDENLCGSFCVSLCDFRSL